MGSECSVCFALGSHSSDIGSFLSREQVALLLVGGQQDKRLILVCISNCAIISLSCYRPLSEGEIHFTWTYKEEKGRRKD